MANVWIRQFRPSVGPIGDEPVVETVLLLLTPWKGSALVVVFGTVDYLFGLEVFLVLKPLQTFCRLNRERWQFNCLLVRPDISLSYVCLLAMKK
jgi:hypothetical protein